MKNKIEIERLECGSAGACGGDQFGINGLTEIKVDGCFWGFVIWEAGSHFSIQKGNEGSWPIGWRKNRDTARKAAFAEVKKMLKI